MITSYQNEMSAVIRREVSDICEGLKGSRLIRKYSEEKGILFTSIAYGTVARSIMGGSSSRPTNSVIDLSSCPLFELPKLSMGPTDSLSPAQVQ